MYNSSLDVIFRVCGLWAKDSCGEGHIAGRFRLECKHAPSHGLVLWDNKKERWYPWQPWNASVPLIKALLHILTEDAWYSTAHLPSIRWKKKKWKLLGCFRLCDPMDPTRLLCPWDFPGKNTGVGCHSLLQGIFSNQGSNLGLPHCRQSLYLVSDQGSPSPLGEPEVTIGTGIHFPSTWPWAETSGNKTLLLCLSFSF